MGIIFLTSSGLLSNEMSSEGTERWLGSLNYVARKLAHVGEYAVLVYLWLRSLWRVRDRFRTCLVWSVALSVAYAVTDEIHQSLVPRRDGVWTDVAWDAAGAVAMALALARVHARAALETQRRLLGGAAGTGTADGVPDAADRLDPKGVE